MVIYHPNGGIIDHNYYEVTEWQQAQKYIKSDDRVLELGARYGCTSVTVNKIVEGKNIICLEPDESVWESLEHNRKINDCDFTIVKGIISKTKQRFQPWDFSSYTIEDENGTVQIHDLWQLQKDFNLTFNVLIADCEGCISTIYHQYQEFFDQLRLVMFEVDRPESFEYSKLTNLLLEKGFECEVDGFHSVYIKR
jgi:FkbM family methyltransferase